MIHRSLHDYVTINRLAPRQWPAAAAAPAPLYLTLNWKEKLTVQVPLVLVFGFVTEKAAPTVMDAAAAQTSL
jgi:hypothetical protein